MPPRPRISYAKPAIEAYLDGLGQQVFTQRQLSTVLRVKREDWRLPTSLGFDAFVTYLMEHSALHQRELVPTAAEYVHKAQIRFTWREASPLEIGNSLVGGSYLSHATAAFIHGLTDERPQTVYVNREQSPKPTNRGALTQGGLDRAFGTQSRQRRSSLIYSDGQHQYVMLSGKNTKNLGVLSSVPDPYGGRVSVTGLERTLVDIAVRPAYAGGVDRVVDIYREARGRAQMSRIIQILQTLDYVYPYHQCIGFYASRAEYASESLERLKKLGLHFDFYITYGMNQPAYDAQWRLYIPKGT